MDASPAIGGGHASRCLALADAMRSDQWTCTFLIGSETARTVPALLRSGHVLIDVEGCEEALEIARTLRPQLAIVDHYRLGFDFEEKVGQYVDRIMVIDDLANRRHCCHILLDPTLGRSEREYAGLAPKECRLLLGPRYALLKDGFAAARAEKPKQPPSSDRRNTIFVCLGSTDPHDLTPLVMQAIAAADLGAHVDVVLGSNSPNADRVQAFATLLGSRYRLHLDCDRVPDVMAQADIAIGSCGTLSWERCALGLPSIGIVTADNQRRIASELAARGAILDGGDWGTATQASLTTLLQEIAGDYELRCRMSSVANSICDGQGSRLVAGHIREMFE